MEDFKVNPPNPKITKMKAIVKEIGKCLTVNKSKGKFTIREYTPTVIDRNKKYTCSGGGTHGKLVRNYVVKGDFDSALISLLQMYSNSVSYGEHENKYWNHNCRYCYICKNKMYVGFTDIPRFCEDKDFFYDNFFTVDKNKNRNVYWLNIRDVVK